MSAEPTIDNIIQFIASEEHLKIKTKLQEVKLKSDISSFNTFSISSYNTHYENFHSDIISSILNPHAAHKESELFLDIFIKFLIQNHDLDLNTFDISEATVSREEEGRIDIGIWDNKTKKVIIIENKINNAIDQDKQLLTYYHNAIAQKYDVQLIIYLSLDGYKYAPIFKEITCPVLNIAAYNDTKLDLANGWISECLNYATHPSSKSFLNEYFKLLHNLNYKAMTKSAIQTFYELLNKDNSLSTVDQIIQLKSELPELRIIALVEKIEDIAPFKNSVRWKPYACQIFQNYYDGVYNYKLDFIFNPNGSALLNLYVPEIERELSDKYIKEKLFKICEQNDISLETIETRKEYIIGSQFNNMKEIDDAIYKDIILLLNCLKIDSGLNL